MNELNQNFIENLETFLMAFKEEVVNGLQEYFRLNSVLSLESI